MAEVSVARRMVAEVLFWLHAVIFSVWILLFFVPLSLWSGRVVFHLCYLVAMVASELVTGFILMPVMGKYRIVCPLTTFMQQVRGVSYRDPGNYDHSFVREFAQRMGIRVPYGLVAVFIFISLAAVIVQYLLGR